MNDLEKQAEEYSKDVAVGLLLSEREQCDMEEMLRQAYLAGAAAGREMGAKQMAEILADHDLRPHEDWTDAEREAEALNSLELWKEKHKPPEVE